MRTLSTTMPDGTTATRRTRHAYSHVLTVQTPRGHFAKSWHGSRALAERAMSKLEAAAVKYPAGYRDHLSYSIVPVTA